MGLYGKVYNSALNIHLFSSALVAYTHMHRCKEECILLCKQKPACPDFHKTQRLCDIFWVLTWFTEKLYA